MTSLAEGSTAEHPEWEVGNEDGVATCCVVDAGCDAPAGHLTPSGAVLEGRVEAGNQCPRCGEDVCDNCQTGGVCNNCVDDEEDDDGE